MDNFTVRFSVSDGIGPKGFQKLLKFFGSAQKAWEGNPNQFKEAGIGESNFSKFKNFRNTFDVEKYLQMMKKAKVEFIGFGDKLFPQSLLKLPDPPIGLFVKGNKKLLRFCHSEFISESQAEIPKQVRDDKKAVIGVVGARKITSYGRQVTENLVSELCSNGFVICSGMALGVDGVAHQTAIDSKGSTIAVLGCGVDCPYPKENERLFEEILDSKGLIISEYPLGMPANMGTFPARNRIIAALSEAVLITEAAEDSGSLITADWAQKLEKKVFSVPGPITSATSKGSLKLIRGGAIMVQSAEDILENLEFKMQNSKSGKRKDLSKFKNLSKEEKKIVEVLESEEKSLDEIAKLTRIKAGKLSIIVSGMELAGYIKNSGGKIMLL